MVYIVVGIWWSLVVVMASLGMQNVDRDIMEKVKVIVVAITWPVYVIPVLVYFAYDALVDSGLRIRHDLQNRGLLREFEEWYAAKKYGTLSQKEE